jgi:hypothetical protein
MTASTLPCRGLIVRCRLLEGKSDTRTALTGG